MTGETVLITRVGGGIGSCLAEEFAKEGATLVLTDIDGGRLRAAKSRLRRFGNRIYTRRMDSSSRAEADRLASWVRKSLGGLDVLVNNAGIGFIGDLAETGIRDWKRLLGTNLWEPLFHTYAFLPAMKERGAGHIVNVSSGQAFFRRPTWGAYAAIKLALGAFSEILAVELRKSGIRVLTVYPFMGNTGFYGSVRPETWAAKLSMRLVPYYSMTSQAVARIVFRAIRTGKSVERVSLWNELAHLTQCVPLVSERMSRAANDLLSRNA